MKCIKRQRSTTKHFENFEEFQRFVESSNLSEAEKKRMLEHEEAHYEAARELGYTVEGFTYRFRSRIEEFSILNNYGTTEMDVSAQTHIDLRNASVSDLRRIILAPDNPSKADKKAFERYRKRAKSKQKHRKKSRKSKFSYTGYSPRNKIRDFSMSG